MNLSKLEKEGKKWVDQGIISEEQLNMILNNYPKKDANILVVLFAVLLTGLALITFIFSDWAQVAHLSRVIVILSFTLFLYILGDQLYRRQQTLYGVSFILLGYIGFSASLFLVINNYNLILHSSWPFIVLTIVGLLLYTIYSHVYLYYISLIALTIGQLYGEFSYVLFILLIIGFSYFAFRYTSKLTPHFFGVSLVINLIALATSFSAYYYWFIIYMFIFYIIAELTFKKEVANVFKFISLSSIFLFNVFQAFYFQEDYILDGNLELSGLFLVVLLILFGGFILIKRITFKRADYIYLILFIPTLYLPYPLLMTIILLFVFSSALLIVGYKKDYRQLITYGTLAFLLSTLTVYIEYAWEVMNKSLFFLIGGLILFSFSFILERNRRKIKEKGSVK